MNNIFYKSLLAKFIKFCVVGGSGVFIDFGFTYLFKEIVKINKYAANCIGFTLAASSNYFLNRIWTYESHYPHIIGEYSKFILVSLLGLGINTLVLWFLVSKLKTNFYISKLFAIGVVTVWNFGLSTLLVFSLK